MTALTPEFLGHIAQRNGEITRLIAVYRAVEAQIAALQGMSDVPAIKVTVHPRAVPLFEMNLPVATLLAQHEGDLATIASRIRQAAAVPLDWIPVQPPAAGAEPAELPASPPTEGDSVHG